MSEEDSGPARENMRGTGENRIVLASSLVALGICCFGSQTKQHGMGGACCTYVGKINAYRFLVGKPERKRQLGEFGRIWEVNIT